MKNMKNILNEQIEYEYRNLPIPGGGYVTGFQFHPDFEDVLYIRTDIGGTYKYDYVDNKWESINEDVSMQDLSLTYPIALATGEERDSLYIVSGVYPHGGDNNTGVFSISKDGGKSFSHKKMPCMVHGNLNGRGTGSRLVRCEGTTDTFYYASQCDGLFKTTNCGDSWELLYTGGEKHMTFVWCSGDGNTVIAGTAGVDTGDGVFRGHSLYVSYDFGYNFEKLIMPENIVIPNTKLSGYVAHRYTYDGKYFYCTLTNTGKRAYTVPLGYSCDCGDVTGGRVLRYSFDDTGRISGYDDITPTVIADINGRLNISKSELPDYGFGGICSCGKMPGLLALTTISRSYGDMVYISYDYGENWEIALYDLQIGKIHFNTSYMKPEYNGGYSLIHWLTDIKLNPHNPDEVWFNTGTGVFRCDNFTDEDRSFYDCCKGIEETVHLNVYSPIDGPVKCIDIVGDLGGFAFTDIDKECENSFSNRQGNRYITCINADYSDSYPSTVIATARGNWTGKTKGGLIISHDYGLTFDRIPFNYGISEYLNARFRRIEMPNNNSGWVAISNDTGHILYSVADGINLYMKGVIVSHNQGKNFIKCRIFDIFGNDISESDLHMKVFADRIQSEIFYGFGDDFNIYISKDCGNTFNQIKTPFKLVGVNAGLIDGANRTEIRAENGKSGIFYAATGKYGLWKLIFDVENQLLDFIRLCGEADFVFAVGLGLLSPDSNYMRDKKAIYICGVIDGEYGFFRSFNDGTSWQKISNAKQNFGIVQSIDGDSRCYGRFFIASGSFGLKYGIPKNNRVEK